MIQFINDCCHENEKDTILFKLPYICELLTENKFWNNIMFFPLSKNKMAIVENYLRIVVNTDYIKFKKSKHHQQKTILRLMLFELLISEIFNLLKKLNFQSNSSIEAVNPKNSNDKNPEKSYDEIVESLIYYFFNVKKIVMITYEAAQAFETLFDENEQDFDKLKTILQKINEKGLNETAYAKFTQSENDGIICEIDDCRDYYAS